MLNDHSQKDHNLVFNTNYRFKSIAECSKGALKHSTILSTFIKLPFVIKIFVLSIFEWPFYTGFTVYRTSAKSYMKPEAVESRETSGLNYRKSHSLLPYFMFVRGNGSGKSLCICAGSPEPLHADAISAKVSHEHAHIHSTVCLLPTFQ